MDVYLIGMHLKRVTHRRASHGRVPHEGIPHGRASHRCVPHGRVKAGISTNEP
jgi:hypothetical protein